MVVYTKNAKRPETLSKSNKTDHREYQKTIFVKNRVEKCMACSEELNKTFGRFILSENVITNTKKHIIVKLLSLQSKSKITTFISTPL